MAQKLKKQTKKGGQEYYESPLCLLYQFKQRIKQQLKEEADQ